MTAGLGLLTRLLRVDTDKFRVLIERGLTEDFFGVEQEREAYIYIREHTRRYGKMPSPEIVNLETSLELPPILPDEPLSFWVDQLFELKALRHLHDSAKEIIDLTESRSLKDAIACTRSMYRNSLQLIGSGTITSLTDLTKPILEEHDEIQKVLRSGSLPGLSFGLPYVDSITGGAQPGDSIIIAAKTSVGKTWLLLLSALASWLSGKKILLFSMEMNKTQIARRLLAMLGSVNSRSLRFGRLSKFGLRKFEQRLQKITRDGEAGEFTIVEGGMRRSFEDVLLLAQELQPNGVWIDGAYLLTGGRETQKMSGWEQQTFVTEMLKAAALDMLVPFIQTHQFSKKGEKEGAEGVGRAKAIADASSLFFRLRKEGSQSADMTYSRKAYRLLDIVKGREGESGCVRLEMDLERGSITEHEVLIHGDSIDDDGYNEKQDDAVR